MRRLKSNRTDEHLGSDQFWEICSRMPAKAAIKFSSLSKSLSALLSDPLFVERQSIHSSLFDGGFFLWRPSSHHSSEKLEFKLKFYVIPSRDRDGQTPSSTLGIPVKSLSFLQQSCTSILSSSHGLVLLKRETDRCCPDTFLICNPATGSCTLLPPPDLPPLKSKGFTMNFLLLECHPRNLSSPNYFPSDYTIIAPVYWDGDVDVDADGYAVDDDYEDEHAWFSSTFDFAVYRNGKWEDTFYLKIEGRQLRVEMPVGIFRGCDRGLVLHYICDSWPCLDGTRPTYEESYIVAYDVERKVLLRTFSLPEGSWKLEEDGDSGSHMLTIFKWRSLRGEETVALARTDERMLRVWVLEDYERGRWRRVVRKWTVDIGVPWEEGAVVGNYILNSMWLLFATKRRVYAYDMAADRLEVVAEHGFQSNAMFRLEFTPYANTLRPVCGREACVFSLGDH